MKKFLPLIFLLLITYSLLLIKPVFAQEPTSTPLTQKGYDLSSFVNINTALEIPSALSCAAVGVKTTTPDGSGCIFYDQQGNLQAMNQPGGGAAVVVANLMGTLYQNPPASSIQYFADLGRSLGLAKPAYAAGTGFTGLTPILPIWKAFRNVAYLFFVIIFIVIGFAIMFRIKISPQAVVTIQSAIPRIVMALILVTFSYAIAGFLIDLMYVFIFLLGGVFQKMSADFPQMAQLNLSEKMNENVISLFGQLPGLGLATILTPAGVVKDVIAAITGGIPGLSGILGVAGGGIAVLIIAFAVVYALFKLFFTLLMSYITVIVLVIFAPFQLLLDALPGQSGFSSWIRNIIANLAVFPATIAMFLIAGVLIESVTQGQNAEQGWVAPLLGSAWGGGLAGLIGLGMILLTPKVAEMVKEALKVPPFKYGTAIGEALGFGAKPVRGGLASGFDVGSKGALGEFMKTYRGGGRKGMWEEKLLENIRQSTSDAVRGGRRR